MVPTASVMRLVQTRGAALLTSSQYRTAGKIQAAIGGGLLMVTAGLGIASATGGNPALAWAMLGPGLAGGINLGIGMLFLKLGGRQREVVRLTPEARGYLVRLVAAVSPNPLRYLQGQSNGVVDIVPSAASVEALEPVAHQANRIQALAESAATGSELDRISPRIEQALNEAIAEALHCAATIARFPEGERPAAERLERIRSELQEIADRCESLSAGKSILDRALPRSQPQELIHELRAMDEVDRELRETF